MPSKTPEKISQQKVKQSTDKHKSEFKCVNKGNDMYRVGLSGGMHGKAKGGHPTKRAEEMKS